MGVQISFHCFDYRNHTKNFKRSRIVCRHHDGRSRKDSYGSHVEFPGNEAAQVEVEEGQVKHR